VRTPASVIPRDRGKRFAQEGDFCRDRWLPSRPSPLLHLLFAKGKKGRGNCPATSPFSYVASREKKKRAAARGDYRFKGDGPGWLVSIRGRGFGQKEGRQGSVRREAVAICSTTVSKKKKKSTVFYLLSSNSPAREKRKFA